LQKINSWLQWRVQTFPIEQSRIQRAIDLGFVMIGKRDRDFRPTIIVQGNRLIGKLEEYSEKELSDCVAFTIGYAIDNLLIPGKVETLNLVFDATDLSVMNFSVTLIKNVVGICASSFPTRFNR